MELSCSTTRREDVTLVAVRLRNPHAEPARVRVENRLEGPVWPPRRNGCPEPGWDESGFEVAVAPGARTGAGYATPARPADPAVEIVHVEPVEEAGPERPRQETGQEGDPGPRARIGDGAAGDDRPARAYPDPRPPRDSIAGAGNPAGVRSTPSTYQSAAGEEP